MTVARAQSEYQRSFQWIGPKGAQQGPPAAGYPTGLPVGPATTVPLTHVTHVPTLAPSHTHYAPPSARHYDDHSYTDATPRGRNDLPASASPVPRIVIPERPEVSGDRPDVSQRYGRGERTPRSAPAVDPRDEYRPASAVDAPRAQPMMSEYQTNYNRKYKLPVDTPNAIAAARSQEVRKSHLEIPHVPSEVHVAPMTEYQRQYCHLYPTVAAERDARRQVRVTEEPEVLPRSAPAAGYARTAAARAPVIDVASIPPLPMSGAQFGEPLSGSLYGQRSEYETRFRPWNEYEYADGAFRHVGGSAGDATWLTQVRELREMAQLNKDRHVRRYVSEWQAQRKALQDDMYDARPDNASNANGHANVDTTGSESTRSASRRSNAGSTVPSGPSHDHGDNHPYGASGQSGASRLDDSDSRQGWVG